MDCMQTLQNELGCIPMMRIAYHSHTLHKMSSTMKSLRELAMYTAVKHRASVPAGWYAVMNGARRVGAVCIGSRSNYNDAIRLHYDVDTSVQPSHWKLVTDPDMSRLGHAPNPTHEIPLELNPDYSTPGWDEFFQQKFGGAWFNVFHHIERNANAIYNITGHRTWRRHGASDRYVARKGCMLNLETDGYCYDPANFTNSGIPIQWLVMNTYSENTAARVEPIDTILRRIGGPLGCTRSILVPTERGLVAYRIRNRVIYAGYRAFYHGPNHADLAILNTIANAPEIYIENRRTFTPGEPAFIKC